MPISALLGINFTLDTFRRLLLLHGQLLGVVDARVMLIVERRLPVLELIEATRTLVRYYLVECTAGLRRRRRKCLLLELAISLARLFLNIFTILCRLALGHNRLRIGLNTHDGFVDLIVRAGRRRGLGLDGAGTVLASASLRSLLLLAIVNLLARIVAIHEGRQWVDLFLLAVRLLHFWLSLRCLHSCGAVVFWLGS